MAVTKPVWGIDLGQCALKAIRVRAAGENAEAVDYAYIEHSRILSSQPDAAAVASVVSETMKKFLETHNLSKENIVVAVPGQHTLARFTKLPPVDKNKIPEIVKYEAQQQIPFDMEEVIWDYQVFSHSADGTEVGIFAMRREVLRDHLSFLSNLNLEPAAVQSTPLALYNALRFDGVVGTEPVVILDIGAQNSDLIISDGASLWTRNIPIGGNNFTEALLKTFKLSFSKAENLKRTAASSKYARQIFQAMRPVFADLVAEIQRSVGFFTSAAARRGIKLSKVVAMGNAFQLPGMVKFLQQNLGMEVVRPTSFGKLSASEVPNAPDLLKQLSSFGVAYGLALQGLGKAQITSNLLPTDIAKQIVWRKKTPWFYGAAACLALGAGLVWSRTMLDSAAIADVQSKAGSPPSYNGTVAKVKDLEIPEPDPRAFSDLDREPTASDNPILYAKTVQAAGQHLNDVLSRLQSLNDKDAQAVKEIAQLQLYRNVWPRILQRVHAALPQDELTKAMADGPEAYKAAVAANADRFKREKRRVIFIEKMQSVYASDVMAIHDALVRSEAGATGGGGARAAAAAAGPAMPGFVITIDGRTPNEEGCAFVNNSFMANLLKTNPPPKKEGAATPDANAKEPPLEDSITFDRVELVRCERLAVQPGLGGGGAGGGAIGGGFAPRQHGGAGGTRRLGGGGSFSAGSLGEVDLTKDPVTGESTQNDLVFQVVFVAVLGNTPAAPAAAAPAADPVE